jgi:hypothetical protein
MAGSADSELQNFHTNGIAEGRLDIQRWQHVIGGGNDELTSIALPLIPSPPAFRVCRTPSSYEADIAAAWKLPRKASGNRSELPFLATNTANSKHVVQQRHPCDQISQRRSH